jgi:hypothetical protein
LFLISFDEHGGTYDHVPPPRVDPPDPAAPPGQMGFRFDRAGVRILALAVGGSEALAHAEVTDTEPVQQPCASQQPGRDVI